MKRLLIIAALCVIPAVTFSHPGKTDWRGGHKCIKGCEDWGLFYAEYHLHDKAGRPIRISKKKIVPKYLGPAALRTAVTETAVPEPAAPKTETVTVYRYVTNVYEENVFSPNPLLWALLVLLLLLLILRMNRKREES
jgi:hypothetical protein